MSSRPLYCGSFVTRAFSLLIASLLLTSQADALPRTWIGGNVDWVDAGSAANWSPADEPDSDDEAIFNTANTVNLGSNNAVNGLTLSGGIDLFANDFDLTVDGLVQLSGAGTNLFVDGAAGSVDADDVTINNNSTIELSGGTLTLNEEVGVSLVDVNVGGNLIGHGTISFADAPGVITAVLVNDGELTALSRGLTIFSPPPAGTLQINNANANARVDLDGTGEAGVVNVNRNQTLDLNAAFADAFHGTMNLFQESHFNSLNAWTLAGGSIVANNGFVDNALPVPDVPAGTSFIEGGLLTQTGGTINVTDTDGTLQFDANFTMSGGTFSNSGAVIFNETTNFTNAASWMPVNSSSTLEINGAMTVTDVAGNFNWDGPGTSSTTINGTGSLSLAVNQVDTADNAYGGTLTLNDDADATINVAGASWSAVGAINKNNAGTSTISGDRVVVLGAINANGGTLDMPAISTTPGANISVAGTLTLGGASEFGGATAITGAGLLRMEGTSTVTADTTINVATFDWDGVGSGTTHTINDGIDFTINSTTWDPDDSGDVDDNVTLGGNGAQLIVNNVANWTMARTLTTNTPDVGVATIGGSSRMILSGGSANLNVNGNTDATARITFGASSTTTIAAAGPLHLKGGSGSDVNEIAGGTINGPGVLRADSGKDLRGFGTIAASVDFDGTARLRADDGTLTINGAITDVGVIGTADADGVLQVTNAWNSNVSTGVALLGGTVQGGTITNDSANGIQGFGTVTSRVINNTQLLSFNGGTLVFETAGNDNDWDGAGGTGLLRATSGTTLELHDFGAAFGFAGTVQADPNGRVFTNGFALDFNPGSLLHLDEGTYESTSSTDLSGTVTVGAGANSTIKVENNFFLTFEPTSATTLNGNLRLENNNINVEAGATFSGGGALVVPDGSHMVADNLADVGVLLDMQGGFRPGNSEGIGRVDLFDYQQANTGELFVELTGTGLNAFDRLVASGDVVIDGYLNIDIDLGFVPVLGNTFNIITGNTVTGEFDYADVSGLPDGLSFHINYLANAVQLQVVNTPLFSADFDDDGDVDPTDLAIWKGAYALNQLGDADGDNDTDGADFLLWQQQFGSAPAVAVAQPAAGAVPEPSAAALLLAALALAGCRRTRQQLAG